MIIEKEIQQYTDEYITIIDTISVFLVDINLINNELIFYFGDAITTYYYAVAAPPNCSDHYLNFLKFKMINNQYHLEIDANKQIIYVIKI